MFTLMGFCFLIIRLSSCLNGADGRREIIFDISVGEKEKTVNIDANSSNVITVHQISSTGTAVLFEAHSHIHNVSLSEQEGIQTHFSVAGRNIGMVYRLHTWESKAQMWLINEGQKSLSVLIIITVFNSDDPIPGGCNMEFPTEIAPYLRLRSNSGKLYLEYQHANLGVFRDEPAPVCSLSLSYITYDVFVSYLRESDFSEEEYFNKIKSMSNSSLIKETSKKVPSYSIHPDTRYSFLMYPNIGVIFNVIAKYTINGVVKEALYVPVSSYGCGSAIFTEHGCDFSYAVEGKAFLFLLSMYGFITAYFGNYFYGSTMFFFGFLVGFFITLILMGRYSSFSKSKILKLSGICGVLFGGCWLLLWIKLKTSVISLLLVGFVLGFLLAATILYSPIGNYEINLNDKNYWLLLVTGSLFVTVILLAYPTVLSVLGSSIVGSYIMLLFYDDFIGTRLAYIILNIVKRAVSENSEFATNDFPFQIKDAVICIAWIASSLFAVIVQSKSLKPSSNGMKVCCCKCERSNQNAADMMESNSREPLLNNNDSVFYNTFNR